MKKIIVLFILLLSIVLSFAQSASSYLSYDWAFFELKGRVRAVVITTKTKYSETEEAHYFSRNGELLDAEDDDFFGWQNGCTRDDRGRIVGTGNAHWSWTWNGKTLVRADWGHMGDESSSIYQYNSEGKKTGYKDEKGKIHKSVYLNHDARGNWTSRSEETGYCFEERKIIYY